MGNKNFPESKNCSTSLAQRAHKILGKIYEKTVIIRFFLVKLFNFKNKENAPQSPRKKKLSHTQRTKNQAGLRFLLQKMRRQQQNSKELGMENNVT